MLLKNFLVTATRTVCRLYGQVDSGHPIVVLARAREIVVSEWLVTCYRLRDVRSSARENLSRSPASSFASQGPARCEQFQLPPSSLKRSQRMPVLCPWCGAQA